MQRRLWVVILPVLVLAGLVGPAILGSNPWAGEVGLLILLSRLAGGSPASPGASGRSGVALIGAHQFVASAISQTPHLPSVGGQSPTERRAAASPALLAAG
jgi:hypothetical protein